MLRHVVLFTWSDDADEERREQTLAALRRLPDEVGGMTSFAVGPDAGLRPGNAHTAEGALGFVLDLVDRVEDRLCQVALVRLDAGFPEEGLLAGLEGRGTPYVARLRSNRVLDRLAAPHLRRPPGRPPRRSRGCGCTR